MKGSRQPEAQHRRIHRDQQFIPIHRDTRPIARAVIAATAATQVQVRHIQPEAANHPWQWKLTI